MATWDASQWDDNSDWGLTWLKRTASAEFGEGPSDSSIFVEGESAAASSSVAKPSFEAQASDAREAFAPVTFD